MIAGYHELELRLKSEVVLPHESRRYSLVCPFTIKRRGQQVRIVISAGDENQSRPVPSLMRVVARSRDWAELIVSGRARTFDDLVKASGLTRAYVKNALRCVVLSPTAD